MPIWEQLLRQHFIGEPLDLSEWMFQCLASFEHGLQHGGGLVTWDTSVQPHVLRLSDFYFHDVTINGVFHSVWNGIDIPEPDLLQYAGVIPNHGQSGQDYIEEHFNYY